MAGIEEDKKNKESLLHMFKENQALLNEISRLRNKRTLKADKAESIRHSLIEFMHEIRKNM